MNQSEFTQFVHDTATKNNNNAELYASAKQWHDTSRRYDYQYMFSWLGIPIIQDPQDVCMLHELLWEVQPDVVIETGIARGGSLMLSASVLALLDYQDILQGGNATPRKVIGIDIDIRPHTQETLTHCPFPSYITTFEGSSIDDALAEKVKAQIPAGSRVLVSLDSNHTHEHVLRELELYAPLVSENSYCLVLDTGVEEVPADDIHGRPWGKGNSPKTAADAYLKALGEQKITATDGNRLKFERDYSYVNRSIISCAREGFLKRINT